MPPGCSQASFLRRSGRNKREARHRNKAVASPSVQYTAAKPTAAVSKKRLSYKDQREWDQMETLIHEAEAKLAQVQSDLQDPAVTSDPVRLQDAYAKLHPYQSEVDRLYERWAELEAKLS